MDSLALEKFQDLSDKDKGDTVAAREASQGNDSKLKSGEPIDSDESSANDGVEGERDIHMSSAAETEKETQGKEALEKMEIDQKDATIATTTRRLWADNDSFGERDEVEGTDKKRTDSVSGDDTTKRDDVSEKASAADLVSWVQCDIAECQKWRKLKNCSSVERNLETRWECSMNLDQKFNDCSIAEEEWSDAESGAEDEDDDNNNVLSLSEGDIVCGRMAGHPWWPAIIEEDPDYAYFVYSEVRGPNARVVNSYHVTFLGKEVCRAWLAASNIRKFRGDEMREELGKVKGKKSLDKALADARAASLLTAPQRILKFGFARRFKGKRSSIDVGKEREIKKQKHGIKGEEKVTAKVAKVEDVDEKDFEIPKEYPRKQTARQLNEMKNLSKKLVAGSSSKLQNAKKKEGEEESKEEKKLRKQIEKQKRKQQRKQQRKEERKAKKLLPSGDIVVDKSKMKFHNVDGNDEEEESEEEELEPSQISKSQLLAEEMVAKYNDHELVNDFLSSLKTSELSFSERQGREREEKKARKLKLKERERKQKQAIEKKKVAESKKKAMADKKEQKALEKQEMKEMREKLKAEKAEKKNKKGLGKIENEKRSDLKVGEERATQEQKEKLVKFYQDIENMPGQKQKKSKSKSSFSKPRMNVSAGENGARPSKLKPLKTPKEEAQVVPSITTTGIVNTETNSSHSQPQEIPSDVNKDPVVNEKSNSTCDNGLRLGSENNVTMGTTSNSAEKRNPDYDSVTKTDPDADSFEAKNTDDVSVDKKSEDECTMEDEPKIKSADEKKPKAKSNIANKPEVPSAPPKESEVESAASEKVEIQSVALTDPEVESASSANSDVKSTSPKRPQVESIAAQASGNIAASKSEASSASSMKDASRPAVTSVESDLQLEKESASDLEKTDTNEERISQTDAEEIVSELRTAKEDESLAVSGFQTALQSEDKENVSNDTANIDNRDAENKSQNVFMSALGERELPKGENVTVLNKGGSHKDDIPCAKKPEGPKVVPSFSKKKAGVKRPAEKTSGGPSSKKK